jgi:hypothetical protein
VDDAVNQVNVTLAAAAKGTSTDIAAKIRSMVELFQELGVTRDQLEIYLNTKCEAASSKQIVDLGKIYTSIKDNYSEPKDWFKMPDMPAELLKEAVKLSENESISELEVLLVKAKELGIPDTAIDILCKKIDTTKPKSVKQGIDFLNTMISDKTLERQADA